MLTRFLTFTRIYRRRSPYDYIPIQKLAPVYFKLSRETARNKNGEKLFVLIKKKKDNVTEEYIYVYVCMYG